MNALNTDNLAIDSDLAAAMDEAIKPYELSQQKRDSMKSRIMNRVQAPAPEGTSTIRFSADTWFSVAPLIEKKVLNFDDQTRRETSLWRLQPGAEFPAHRHAGVEECTVLEGDLTFGNHLLRKGDFHLAAAGVEHQASFSRSGALLLITAVEEDTVGPS